MNSDIAARKSAEQSLNVPVPRELRSDDEGAGGSDQGRVPAGTVMPSPVVFVLGVVFGAVATTVLLIASYLF